MGLDPAHYPNLVPRLAGLSSAIAGAPLVEVAGTWIRDMPAGVLRRDLRSLSPDLLWTGGFRVGHSRYVRRHAFPAYHLSDGVTTASAEVFGGGADPHPVLGIPPKSRLQLLVQADVRAVLDLTDPAACRLLGVSAAELTQIPDYRSLDTLGRPRAYELTQAIGELAREAGAGGIKFPAARATTGVNLVVFTEHLGRLGGSLVAEDPVTGATQRLP